MESIYIGAIALCISIFFPAAANAGSGLYGYQNYCKTETTGRNPPDKSQWQPVPVGRYSLSEVSLFDVRALTQRDRIRISWKVAGEENGTYTVERSRDGVGFSPVETFGTRGLQDYSVDDNNPLNGNNFYRIVFTDKQNKNMYSKTVAAAFTSRESFKSYYAYDGRIMVNISIGTYGTYQLAVINYMGQVVYKNELKYDGSGNVYEIHPGNNLNPGIYAIILTGNNMRLSCQILVK